MSLIFFLNDKYMDLPVFRNKVQIGQPLHRCLNFQILVGPLALGEPAPTLEQWFKV